MPPVLGENILKRTTPAAALAMQEAIQAAGGREVFFAGSLDSQGRVERVRVCARGHAGAVPAIFEGLDAREVAIHNHPGGDLTPSDADLSLAAMYSAHGHGMFIVDNEVTRVYVVIEPFIARDVVRLDARELGKVLGPTGPVARALPGFEHRPQQGRMLEAVAGAFNRDGIAVVEAPTGVGKTLAYLVPAVQWALANKERVVISTRTINLQEQLIEKDIPLLQRALGQKFTACLVKGRSNYLCWRKLERAVAEASLFEEADTKEQLDYIVVWAETTEDGSKADLPFVPGRELWERLSCEADTCSLGRCPKKAKCFIGKARREIATADLIVVNHHMLFADLALRLEAEEFSAQAVLPVYRRVIFDEAHSIEDSATEYFGVTASRGEALATLGQFLRVDRGRERGLMPMIKLRLMHAKSISSADFEKVQDIIDLRFLPALSVARDAVGQYFDRLREYAAERSDQITRDVKWRLTQAALGEHALRQLHAQYTVPAVESVTRLLEHGKELAALLDSIRPKDDEDAAPMEDDLVQLRAYFRRMERIALAVGESTGEHIAENTVRWVEIDARNPGSVRTVRAPLDVGRQFAERVYPQLKTVVMTSATLAAGDDFSYLFRRLGLDRSDPGRIETVRLDSPFDFEQQALLGIATDLPSPDARDFNDQCAEFLLEALTATRGRAFVLFTAYGALDRAYRQIEQPLRAQGILPLKQGDAARTQLLNRFKSDPASVLFATDSFWEGVDVPGEALECVILPKLPFRVPTEPIQQARAEAIAAAGGNSFMEFSVPQAVIKFRQGFGRLIRRRSDRGVILVLDSRIVSRYYGRMFLAALPPIRIIKGPRQGIQVALREFFATESVP
jgi:ATP-dependent DNA helicase DinG